MTNTELCRHNLYKRLGLDNLEISDSLRVGQNIRSSNRHLDETISLARPRLIMGAMRYCGGWEHEPLMEYMQRKFSEYRETGNFEMLVDLFNFCAIEKELKTHPKFHFKAKDRE